MIKTLIIEDEQKSREMLAGLIEKNCPGLMVAGLAKNVKEGVEQIQALKPELVFLDITASHEKRETIVLRGIIDHRKFQNEKSLLTIAILVIFLAPFAFMIFTSLKTQEQISIVGAPIWPAKPRRNCARL